MNRQAAERRTDRLLFVGLVVVGLIGTVIGVPWEIAVLSHPAAGGTVDLRLSWLLAGVEALVFLAPASAVGVWLGRKVGLGPRLLRQIVSRAPDGCAHLRQGLLPAAVVGVALGLIGYFLQSSIPRSALIPGLDNPNTVEMLLRTLSAALTEEILFRLGLMTVCVWVIRSIARGPGIHRPSLWAGNGLAALLFAAAHTPQLTPQAVGWSFLIPFIAVSGTAGMIMGWVYMRHGLALAMVAHFVVDLVVPVIPRLLPVTL